MKEKAFNNFKHNGVHLSFPNGNMISTIWGRGSYSDNYDGTGDTGGFLNDYQTFMESDTVEIMVDCSDKLFKKLQKRLRLQTQFLEWLL